MTNFFKNWISFGTATALFIGVSQAMSPTSANAADMLEGEGETLVEFGTGWYLRGDIGGAITEVTAETNAGGGGEFDLGNPISFSVGAGYDAGDGFRYEFGLSQMTGLSFAGRNDVSCGSEQVGLAIVPVTGNCFTSLNGDVTASSASVSAYKDFAKIGSFTPYVGVGAGFAVLSSSNMRWLTVCDGASSTDCGLSGGVGPNIVAQGVYTPNTSFALQGNAMLGASYDISENMKLDFGYKYTYVGSSTLATASGNAFDQEDLELEALQNHELRVGIRYAIW